MGRRFKAKIVRNCDSPFGDKPSGKNFPPEIRSHPRWLIIMVCIFLAAAVWVVFGQTRLHEFVNYDDNDYVCDNPVVTQGLSWNGIVWAFTHRHAGNWHPLTTLSHMLDCRIYGLHPVGHHLTNVLLHAVTVILLFLMLRNLTGAFWRSAFVAAVFAIHPLRVESVAWVAERKDVLSGLFFVLTLWAYGRYVQYFQDKNSKSKVWYGLALGLFVLGLMSKPMLVTLPFILLLLDYWPLKRIENYGFGIAAWRRLVLEKQFFFLLAAVDCGVTILAQNKAAWSYQAVDFPSRIGNALISYAVYLGQMVFPANLAVLYPHPGNHLYLGKVAVSLLVLLLISAGVWAGRRRHPYLLVGWLWYLGMLVPVIGLVQVGTQARADRYTYLPQIGLYFLLTWGGVALCRKWPCRRAVLGTAAAVILAGLMRVAHVQAGYWQDSITLWTHALICTSENYTAYNNLGIALADRGQSADAIQCYRQAVQLKPDYADAQRNLGARLILQGNLDEAVQHLDRALQLKPDFAEAHNDLGVILAQKGKLDEAVQHFGRALQLNPDYAPSHRNLGSILMMQGRLDESAQHLNRALQLKPDFAEAYNDLGATLSAQRKLNDALSQFQQALNLAQAQNNGALVENIRTRLKAVQITLSQPERR